jgi:uncharacterized membrane protein
MKRNPILITTAALVIASAIVGALLYNRLPDPVPTHFDWHGHPDGFTAKRLAVLIAPAVLALTGLIFSVLPAISPRGWRIDPFLRTYEILATAILAVEFGDITIALASAVGYDFDRTRVLTIGLALLFLIVGNYMGKLTRNFFVGIRTPWTLANDEVWLRTHRLGGPLFVAGGAVLLISAFLNAKFAPYAILAVVGALALALTIYSYVLYRRIENGNGA